MADTIKIKFTKTGLAALPAKEAEYVVWDDTERGLAVRVSPKGVKSYFFLGRVGGALKRVSLGRVDVRPLDEVRDDARKLRAGAVGNATVAYGARGIRVDEAFSRWLKAPGKGNEPKKIGTLKGYRSDYRSHIGPALGSRYVSSIAKPDVDEIVGGLIEAGHAPMAGKVGRCLKAFVNYCRAEGWHKGDHPCEGIYLPKPDVRTRYLSRAEVAAIAMALDTVETNPHATAAIRLMLLLGLRVSECLGLRWDMIDFEAGAVRIPHAKGKPRTVMLSDQTRTLLGSLIRLQGNPHVFPGHKKGHHLTDIRKPFNKVLAAAGITDCRRHDLRRTFGSYALQAGATMEEVAALLGHGSIQVTERVYAFLGDRELAAATNRVGSAMDKLMKADLPGSVVPMRRQS